MPRRSLPKLAPTLVVVLGIAVASIMALFGFLQLRAHADEAVALRAKVLALTLAERLRAADPVDRPAIVEKAARRSSTELLLVEQNGHVVVDRSMGAPETRKIVELLLAGSGEATTREGRSRFYAAPLPAPLSNLVLLVFAPAPELPFATRSLLASVAALTAILVGAAALVAFAIARNVNADVSYVRERIVEMALEGKGPSGRAIPVRDMDQVGILTTAFNLLVERFTAAEHAYQHDLQHALEFDRDRTAFLSALSHELRTPLNAILGFTDVLLAEVDGPLSDEARDNLTVLRSSADHLRALIDDILDLSALESGELKLDIQALDLFAIAAEVAREARVNAQGKPLEIILGGTPAVALADPRRVRQILGNVVGNAVKFTREGSVDIHVGLDGDFVEIDVTDTGPGIPAEQRAAIFEEYWQAPASRQSRTGAGLGLAITRRLVRMHGGTIGVESEPGRGSKFTVRLPIRPMESRPVRFISTAPPPPDMVVEPLR